MAARDGDRDANATKVSVEQLRDDIRAQQSRPVALEDIGDAPEQVGAGEGSIDISELLRSQKELVPNEKLGESCWRTSSRKVFSRALRASPASTSIPLRERLNLCRLRLLGLHKSGIFLGKTATQVIWLRSAERLPPNGLTWNTFLMEAHCWMSYSLSPCSDFSRTFGLVGLNASDLFVNYNSTQRPEKSSRGSRSLVHIKCRPTDLTP